MLICHFRTRAKSSMDRIPGPGQTRPFRGVKFAQAQSLSKSVIFFSLNYSCLSYAFGRSSQMQHWFSHSWWLLRSDGERQNESYLMSIRVYFRGKEARKNYRDVDLVSVSVSAISR